MKLRRAIVQASVLGVGLLLASPQPAWGQDRGQSARQPQTRGRADPPFDLRIFHGAGRSRPQPEGPEADPVTPPLAMSAAKKLEILATVDAPEPGIRYVRLSPSEPSVPGRGAFVFVAPQLVEGGQDYVRFIESTLPGAGPSRAMLWIYSPPGRKYLIDCAISGVTHIGIGTRKGPVLTVTGPDHATQTFDFRPAPPDPAGYHLVFVLEANDSGWYPFGITSGASAPNEAVIWNLHACEASSL